MGAVCCRACYGVDSTAGDLRNSFASFTHTRPVSVRRDEPHVSTIFTSPGLPEGGKATTEKPAKIAALLSERLRQSVLLEGTNNEQVIHELVQAMVSRDVEVGTETLVEGEITGSFFVVESGLFEMAAAGTATATCGAGESFGELSLLYATPQPATVRCMREARVWMLDRQTYRSVVVRTQSLSRAGVESALQSVELLSVLSTEQMACVVEAVKQMKFAANEVIYHLGDPASQLYFVLSGRVQITVASEDSTVVDGALSTSSASSRTTVEEGGYFGESALLRDVSVVRDEEAVACEPCRCLTLDRATFHSLLGSLREIVDRDLKRRVLGKLPVL